MSTRVLLGLAAAGAVLWYLRGRKGGAKEIRADIFVDAGELTYSSGVRVAVPAPAPSPGSYGSDDYLTPDWLRN